MAPGDNPHLATLGLNLRQQGCLLLDGPLPAAFGSIQTCGDLFPVGYVFASRDEDELVAKVIWRVKLVAELPTGVTREMEIACLERDEQAGFADLGLRLTEAKQLTATLTAEMVSTQVNVMSERCRWCGTCGRVLTSKGYYPATLRSLFGDVPVQVRRLLACPCQGSEGARVSPCSTWPRRAWRLSWPM